MKSYEEMAREVFQARDAFLKKKQRQKALFYRYAPVAASFCFTVLIGLHIWKEREALPEIITIPETVTESTEAETQKPETIITNMMIIETEISISETAVSEQEISESVPERSETSVCETISAIIPEETEKMTEISEIISSEPLEIIPETEVFTSVITEIYDPTEPEIIPETEPIPEQITEPSDYISVTETAVSEFIETADSPTESEEIVEELPFIITLSPQKTNAATDTIPESIIETEIPEGIFCYYPTEFIINEEFIGDWLDHVDINLINLNHSVSELKNIGDAYEIKGISPDLIVAVKFTDESEFRIFRNEMINLDQCKTMLENAGIAI